MGSTYWVHRLVGFLLLCLFWSVAMAGNFNVDDRGVAIHGHDPVAYFDAGPSKGNPDYNARYENAEFHFVNAANRDRFIMDPQKYAPQFGGYCTYGVRMGKKLDIDPEAYAVLNDKLYMLLNRSTKEIWDRDRNRNIGIAKRLWPKIAPIPAVQLNKAN